MKIRKNASTSHSLHRAASASPTAHASVKHPISMRMTESARQPFAVKTICSVRCLSSAQECYTYFFASDDLSLPRALRSRRRLWKCLGSTNELWQRFSTNWSYPLETPSRKDIDKHGGLSSGRVHLGYRVGILYSLLWVP